MLAFLRDNARVFEVDLSDERLGRALAADAKLFDEVTAALRTRGIYSDAVWRYALVADKGGRELAEYVAMTASLTRKWLHPFFSGDSAEYDPVQRADWYLAELAPLICPRAHSDGVLQRLSAHFLVDLKLLFSASPFSLDSDNDKICAVSPNETAKISLPGARVPRDAARRVRLRHADAGQVAHRLQGRGPAALQPRSSPTPRSWFVCCERKDTKEW